MFAGLSTTELTQLRTDVLAAYRRSLNATSWAAGARNLSRAQPEQLFKQLREIDAALARRGDSSGGIGVIEFGAVS